MDFPLQIYLNHPFWGIPHFEVSPILRMLRIFWVNIDVPARPFPAAIEAVLRFRQRVISGPCWGQAAMHLGWDGEMGHSMPQLSFCLSNGMKHEDSDGISSNCFRWNPKMDFFSQALDFRRHWTDAFSGGAGLWVGHTDPGDGHCFPWIGPVLPSHQIFTLGMATSLSHGCGLLIHSSNSPISASSKRSYHCGWVLSRFRDIWLDA